MRSSVADRELVLTTGIGLPDEPVLQARYVAELAAVGAAGLAVELGRWYSGCLPRWYRPRRSSICRWSRSPGRSLFVEVTEAAAGGNKAAAAQRAHLARPTLYERLRHIERVLGVSLDSAESRTSLHVARLAVEASPGSPPASTGR